MQSLATPDRPGMVLPDRRLSRRPTVVGNRRPWHPVSNPFGLASGTVIYGPPLDGAR